MPLPLYSHLSRRLGFSTVATRRDFLQTTIATGMASLLSNRGLTFGGFSSPPRVVVVGAGFAGLSCAFELVSAGYQVTVIEASQRVGGRVLSFKDFVNGKNVEGGGEFIGSNHPTWGAYKQKFGLEFLDVSAEEDLDSPVRFDGTLLTAEQVNSLFKEMETATAQMTELAQPILADQPWDSPKAAQLDKQSIADWITRLDISDLGKKLISIQLSSDNAIANEQASLLGMLAVVKGGGGEKFWTDSEVYRCAGGNGTLAQKLSEGIGMDKFLFGEPVETIDTSGKTARVMLKGGAFLEFDQVVLAIPPSTWKNVKFTPELGAQLKPQMGVACKYLAEVGAPFWRKAKLSQYAWSDGAVAQAWELTDGQPTDLVGWGLGSFSGGPSAVKSLGFKKEERDTKYAEELEALFPGFGENVKRTRMMDWPNNPFTLAGYAFPALGEVTTISRELHSGLNNLHFCGEHACLKFVGYMEGALNCGVTVAQNIVAATGGK